MNYWQIAAGDGTRDYSNIFLEYGIMLIGPGDPGEYFNNKAIYEEISKKYKTNETKVFAEEIKDGDFVTLKKPAGNGLWEIIAIGKVKGEYDYLEVFEDVDGWDLQHCRYVEWKKPKSKIKTKGLARGTIRKINNNNIIAQLKNIFNSQSVLLSPKQIPVNQEKLKDEDLINILINYGLRPKDAEDFAETVRRIRRLLTWYYQHGKDVKEHETRTFLIIPLLLALGWPEQKLKIEWDKIDIAFFEKPYTKENTNNQCVIILESKKLWEGLDFASSQVTQYAKKYPKCKKLIVSDGCCYKLFKRSGSKWEYSAYLNILKPRQTHPFLSYIGGAPDIFFSIMEK